MTTDARQFLLAAAAVHMSLVLTGCAGFSGEAGAVERTSAPNPVSMRSPRPPDLPDPADSVRVPSSIDATGSQDVSRAMESFIRGVPNGTAIVFPAGATYRLAGDGIVLTGRRDLVFEGQGATLEFTGCRTNDSAFKLIDTRRIVIRDFVLVGGFPGGDQQADCQSSSGVGMYGARDTTISLVDVRRPYGHCWYTDQTDASGWTDGARIEDSSCVLAGTMGFAATAGRNVTIERSTFKDITLFPFDIEPDEADGGGEHITMRDNRIDGFGLDSYYEPWVLAAAPDIGSYENIVFERNHVVRGASHGATLAGLATRMDGDAPKYDIVIRDNTTDVPGKGPVMRFRNVHGLTVSGNVQPLEKGSLTSCSVCTDTVIR